MYRVKPNFLWYKPIAAYLYPTRRRLMAKIVVIGSTNTDMVVKTPRFPAAGETIIGGKFFLSPGGKGANQAVAAARLGAAVAFVGKTGDDLFGEQALAGFSKEKINTTHCTVTDSAAAGVALITVNEGGDNTIVVAPGANHALTEADIDAALPLIDEADIVLLQLEIPLATVAYAIERAAALDKHIVLNPAPATHLPDALLQKVWLITPNETEASLLTGIAVKDEESALHAAHALIAKGVGNVVVTLGAKGALFVSEDDADPIPAKPVKAIDTTAAGDIFNGALCVALAEGQTWPEALSFATTAAAISVTRMGAQSSAPSREEVLHF